MRKLIEVALFLLVFAALAVAQSDFEMKWHCAKPVDQQYDIGDAAGHSYGVAQGNCNVVFSKTGEKTGVFTELQEMWKESFETHGRMIVTMDDGEKVYYSYEATGSPAKKTAAEKWTMTGGSGKYKGNRGSGTCSGTFNEDGTSDWVCSGKFSTGT